MDPTTTEQTINDDQHESTYEAIEPDGGSLIESLDDSGWNWRVQLIRAGTSANGNYYPLNVLHEASPVYSGVPAFYGKGKDHNPNERGFDSVAGWITETAPNTIGIEGTLEISRGKPEVRDAVRHAWDVKQRTGRETFGFSHVIPAGGFKATRRQPKGWTVEAIHKAESVDIVMTPAAGGGILAPLSESVVPDTLKEALVDTEKLLAKLRAGDLLPDDEMNSLVEAVGWKEVHAALAEAKAGDDDDKAPTPIVRKLQENKSKTGDLEARLEEAERKAEERVALLESKTLLAESLSESKLPKELQAAIREDFAGKVFDSHDLEKRIERDAKLAESLMPAGKMPTLSGGPEVTEDQQDKWQKAMDGMFNKRPVDGITPFRSLKEAFMQITGRDFSYIDGHLPRAILGEAINYAGDDPNLQESITSSTFGQVLGDSITRRMLREYMMEDRQTWRAISDIVPVNDFRTQRRPRWGGYGLLDVVPEGTTYQSVDSPTDEEATDSLDKYGGLEDLTMETIANDDIGQVRRIPQKMGQSAIDTIYNAVWNTTILSNATASYDATALYDNAHNNTGTTALGETGLNTMRAAMRDQTEYGNQSGLPLGAANLPRILAVPNELEITAYKLVNSPTAVISAEDATTPNMFRGQFQVIVVDDWTDGTDWYGFADPNRVPALEVGFWNGRETPELFVQDAQTVGSVFTADKITYKIRHVWYVMIVDHRATYRMVVAGG